MKISPITINNIHYKKYTNTTFKQSNKQVEQQVVENNNNIQKITFDNVAAYLITSNDDRIYTSSNPELVEIPHKFKVNTFDNVPCPACGKKLLPLSKFDEFNEKLDNTKPENYLSLLNEYKDYMRPVEYSVFQEITALSKQMETTDIRTLLCNLRDTKLPSLSMYS